MHTIAVSIRFEVRGGSRLARQNVWYMSAPVSIRFEVRGGSRLRRRRDHRDPLGVSIRFKVRGGSRPQNIRLASSLVGFNPL